MGFIPRNEGFECEQCHSTVLLAKGTFRNHCPTCLTSKHVDDAIPGDRLATCQGLMPAIKVEGTDPDALDIIHACSLCQKTIRNRMASDDNKEKLFELMRG